MNPNQLKEFLNAKYQNRRNVFQFVQIDELKLSVKLNDRSANELLNDVLPFGNKQRIFLKKYRVSTDIFIQTCNHITNGRFIFNYQKRIYF